MNAREVVELSGTAKAIIHALINKDASPPKCSYTGRTIEKKKDNTYVWMGYEYILVYVPHIQQYRVNILRLSDFQAVGYAYSTNGMYRVRDDDASESTS